MSLQSRLVAYVVVVHLLLAVLVLFLYETLGLWVLLVEAAILITAVAAVRLVRQVLEPMRFIQSGSEILEEGEYATRFVETGQSEMDRLIGVYNRMLESLQDERQRTGEQRGILDRLLQATPVGVIAFGFDDTISIANPAAASFLRREAEELQGRRLEAVGGTLAVRLQALERGDVRVVPIQGGRRLRCRRSWFHDRSFKRDFVLIEELTEELRQTEKAAYGRLIRMMSHEVNNSLGSANSLLHSIRALKEKLAPDEAEAFAQAVDAVIGRNDNLNRFMRGFADVIRAPKPQPEPADLPAMLESVGRLLSADLRSRNIAWQVEIDDDLPVLRLDAHLFEQVLINIVRNAMEAIEQDGRVQVRLSSKRRHALLEVVDSAGALTEAIESEIFTPFFTTKPTGQGVGLTLVAEILTGHGFPFALESGPNETTVFSIRIPHDG